jgi:hypothetical protein
MSRHKAMGKIIQESAYDDYGDDYGDEYQIRDDDEDYGDEAASKKAAKKKKNKPKKGRYFIIFALCLLVATQVDEKEVKAVFDMFAGFFTMEQVKSTLIANIADPDKTMKTINDLKFKQGKPFY